MKTETNTNKKLLSYDELVEIIEAISPDKIAGIISKYFVNVIVFRSDGSCYKINKHLIYEDITIKCGNVVLTDISKLIYDSFESLDKKDQNKFKEITGYKKIFTNESIKKYTPQLTPLLTNDEVAFDSYINRIHFINGYFNFETNKFYPRHLGEHFITRCVGYEYKKSNPFDEKKVYQQLKKIYTKSEVLDVMLDVLGSALTGQAIRGSYILFLLGKAAAGKSTILEMTKSAVECYVKQIKPDTFAEGKNQDKIVNTYHKGSYIRITWVNEPKDKSIDGPFFKAWADGECNAEKLYQEGTHDFKHYSLTIFTANTMPRFKLDGGVRRRVKAYEHKSRFTENKNEVNEAEHVYLADQDFKYDFDDNIEMKLAFFSLLAQHAHEWLVRSKKIDLPEEFTETINNVLDSNDIIKDFIDGNLVVTDNKIDRISKRSMLELFNKVYPNKHFEVTQLTTLLKEKGLKYDHGLRSKGVQGSFYMVKMKGDVIEESDLTIEQQISSLENQKYGIEQMILKLKQQLPITKDDFNIQQKVVKEIDGYDYDSDDDYVVQISKDDFEIRDIYSEYEDLKYIHRLRKLINEYEEKPKKVVRKVIKRDDYESDSDDDDDYDYNNDFTKEQNDTYIDPKTKEKFKIDKHATLVFDDKDNFFGAINYRKYFD